MSSSTYERTLLEVLRADDPARALEAQLRRRSLPRPVANALERIDLDGLRMTALLVARLRFERLIHGSRAAEAWFERDPEGFTHAFRAYHRDVAPTAFFPSAEAKLFAAWLKATRGPARRPRRAARP